jgi:hypothetical protein
MRLRVRVISAFLISTTSTLACHEPTAPQPAALVVEVASTTVIASRGGLWAQFTVPVTLRNVADVAIRIEGCGPLAERAVAPREYRTALSPFCDLIGSGLEIPAYGELVEQAQVTGSLSSAAGPMFLDGVLEGRYRLVYFYSVPGSVGDLPQARSAPFDVTE